MKFNKVYSVLVLVMLPLFACSALADWTVLGPLDKLQTQAFNYSSNCSYRLVVPFSDESRLEGGTKEERLPISSQVINPSEKVVLTITISTFEGGSRPTGVKKRLLDFTEKYDVLDKFKSNKTAVISVEFFDGTIGAFTSVSFDNEFGFDRSDKPQILDFLQGSYIEQNCT